MLGGDVGLPGALKGVSWSVVPLLNKMNYETDVVPEIVTGSNLTGSYRGNTDRKLSKLSRLVLIEKV